MAKQHTTEQQDQNTTEEQDQAQSIIRILCYSPDACEIMLTGTFNDWNPAALPLTRSADGQWSVDLQLPRGRYEYKFVVDGISCCEPHFKNAHPGCDLDKPHTNGDLNRILLVR